MHTHTFTTLENSLETLWQPGVIQTSCKTRRCGVVFKGPQKQRTSSQQAYVQHLYTAVQRLLCTSRNYPKGIQKSSVRPVLWRTPGVQFAKRTSGGSPLYVHITDSTIHPSDLAYVRPKVQIAPFCVLSDPKPKLTPSTKPFIPS